MKSATLEEKLPLKQQKKFKLSFGGCHILFAFQHGRFVQCGRLLHQASSTSHFRLPLLQVVALLGE